MSDTVGQSYNTGFKGKIILAETNLNGWAYTTHAWHLITIYSSCFCADMQSKMAATVDLSLILDSNAKMV